MSVPRARVRSWTPGSADDNRAGLIGWVSIEYGDLRVDGIAVRRTLAGRFVLAFPSRVAKNGRKHSIVQPMSDEARIEIERVIFAELGQRDDLGAAAEEVDHG